MATKKTATPSEPTTTSLSLQQKLFEIMQAITHIEKDGNNTFHKYKYASEYAIKTSVRHQLLKQRVMFQLDILDHSTSTIDGQTFSMIQTRYTFTDVDTGDVLSGTFAGTGADKGDKGLYKAITGAIKYILTSQFLIPTGDDPEKDDISSPKTPIILSQTHRNKIDDCKSIEELKNYYNENQGLGEVFNAYITKRKLELTSSNPTSA